MSLYERDFYAWANEQAALLRSGNLSAADIENIAEEIESMGKSEKRELDNPSLKSKVSEALEDAYGDAILAAARETGVTRSAFPTTCLWTFEQIMDEEFWPEASPLSH